MKNIIKTISLPSTALVFLVLGFGCDPQDTSVTPPSVDQVSKVFSAFQQFAEDKLTDVELKAQFDLIASNRTLIKELAGKTATDTKFTDHTSVDFLTLGRSSSTVALILKDILSSVDTATQENLVDKKDARGKSAFDRLRGTRPLNEKAADNLKVAATMIAVKPALINNLKKSDGSLNEAEADQLLTTMVLPAQAATIFKAMDATNKTAWDTHAEADFAAVKPVLKLVMQDITAQERAAYKSKILESYFDATIANDKTNEFVDDSPDFGLTVADMKANDFQYAGGTAGSLLTAYAYKLGNIKTAKMAERTKYIDVVKAMKNTIGATDYLAYASSADVLTTLHAPTGGRTAATAGLVDATIVLQLPLTASQAFSVIENLDTRSTAGKDSEALSAINLYYDNAGLAANLNALNNATTGMSAIHYLTMALATDNTFKALKRHVEADDTVVNTTMPGGLALKPMELALLALTSPKQADVLDYLATKGAKARIAQINEDHAETYLKTILANSNAAHVQTFYTDISTAANAAKYEKWLDEYPVKGVAKVDGFKGLYGSLASPADKAMLVTKLMLRLANVDNDQIEKVLVNNFSDYGLTAADLQGTDYGDGAVKASILWHVTDKLGGNVANKATIENLATALNGHMSATDWTSYVDKFFNGRTAVTNASVALGGSLKSHVFFNATMSADDVFKIIEKLDAGSTAGSDTAALAALKHYYSQTAGTTQAARAATLNAVAANGTSHMQTIHYLTYALATADLFEALKLHVDADPTIVTTAMPSGAVLLPMELALQAATGAKTADQINYLIDKNAQARPTKLLQNQTEAYVKAMASKSQVADMKKFYDLLVANQTEYHAWLDALPVSGTPNAQDGYKALYSNLTISADKTALTSKLIERMNNADPTKVEKLLFANPANYGLTVADLKAEDFDIGGVKASIMWHVTRALGSSVGNKKALEDFTTTLSSLFAMSATDWSDYVGKSFSATTAADNAATAFGSSLQAKLALRTATTAAETFSIVEKLDAGSSAGSDVAAFNALKAYYYLGGTAAALNAIAPNTATGMSTIHYLTHATATNDVFNALKLHVDADNTIVNTLMTMATNPLQPMELALAAAAGAKTADQIAVLADAGAIARVSKLSAESTETYIRALAVKGKNTELRNFVNDLASAANSVAMEKWLDKYPVKGSVNAAGFKAILDLETTLGNVANKRAWTSKLVARLLLQGADQVEKQLLTNYAAYGLTVNDLEAADYLDATGANAATLAWHVSRALGGNMTNQTAIADLLTKMASIIPAASWIAYINGSYHGSDVATNVSVAFGTMLKAKIALKIPGGVTASDAFMVIKTLGMDGSTNAPDTLDALKAYYLSQGLTKQSFDDLNTKFDAVTGMAPIHYVLQAKATQAVYDIYQELAGKLAGTVNASWLNKLLGFAIKSSINGVSTSGSTLAGISDRFALPLDLAANAPSDTKTDDLLLDLVEAKANPLEISPAGLENVIQRVSKNATKRQAALRSLFANLISSKGDGADRKGGEYIRAWIEDYAADAPSTKNAGFKALFAELDNTAPNQDQDWLRKALLTNNQKVKSPANIAAIIAAFDTGLGMNLATLTASDYGNPVTLLWFGANRSKNVTNFGLVKVIADAIKAKAFSKTTDLDGKNWKNYLQSTNTTMTVNVIDKMQVKYGTDLPTVLDAQIYLNYPFNKDETFDAIQSLSMSPSKQEGERVLETVKLFLEHATATEKQDFIMLTDGSAAPTGSPPDPHINGPIQILAAVESTAEISKAIKLLVEDSDLKIGTTTPLNVGATPFDRPLRIAYLASKTDKNYQKRLEYFIANGADINDTFYPGAAGSTDTGNLLWSYIESGAARNDIVSLAQAMKKILQANWAKFVSVDKASNATTVGDAFDAKFGTTDNGKADLDY